MRITIEQLRRIVAEELREAVGLSPDDRAALAAAGLDASPNTAVAMRGLALAETVIRGLPGMDTPTAAAFLGAFQSKFRKKYNLI